MSWLFSTHGSDAQDEAAAKEKYDPVVNYCGVTLLFCGGRLRTELVLKGCPFNKQGWMHDCMCDLIDPASDNYDACDRAFLEQAVKHAQVLAAGNIDMLNHLVWFARALYRVAHEWGQMRCRLAKWHINWS